MEKISVCIPTYNNERTLNECLSFVISQNYPKNLIEIIIVDGGSNDNTIGIAKKYTNIILKNKKKVEEYAKAIGIEKSTGSIIVFVDADNFLVNNNTFKIIDECFFNNPKIVFCEPRYYESRITDDKITKYISLIGGDDPVAVYLGIYDRFSYLKNKWTDSPYEVIKKNENYSILKLLDIQDMPPFGANVCFIRKEKLLKIDYDPFLHTDIIFRLLKNNNFFAKINIGIIHKQDGFIKSFLNKKKRRITRDYNNFKKEYYFKFKIRSVIAFIIKLAFILPILIDSIVGYKRKKSRVWFYHPLITYAVVFLYVYNLILKKMISNRR